MPSSSGVEVSKKNAISLCRIRQSFWTPQLQKMGAPHSFKTLGNSLSYQDHIPECINASFMYKLDISGGGGTVIVAVLQTGKLKLG